MTVVFFFSCFTVDHLNTSYHLCDNFILNLDIYILSASVVQNDAEHRKLIRQTNIGDNQ